MKLGRLLADIAGHGLRGDPETEITGLAYDSRRVRPGDLFVALRGQQRDGHAYIEDAVRRGAAALVVEEVREAAGAVAVAPVSDSRQALSRLAARFYGHPYRGVNLIGITGTNGKTTTSYLLEAVLRAAGARPGVMGTINYRFAGRTYPAPVTTPESLDLMRLLREMADSGVTDVVLEVSSHALEQRRTEGCPFRVAVFTNLSRDHLDYHPDMEAYFRAKRRLFTGLGQGRDEARNAAVINMDDPRGAELARSTRAPVTTYGLGRDCQVRAHSIRVGRDGLKARLVTPAGERDLQSALIGEINLYNILAASAAAAALGLELDAIVEGIRGLQGVPGRLESVPNARQLKLIVDYAHTPDALAKALKTLRPLTGGRLIAVFGCGGDRDRGKRSEMGLAAGEGSDLVVITSDNPRSEDPLAIIDGIEEGVRRSGMRKLEPPGPADPVPDSGYLVEPDRSRAIRMAARMAGAEDIVLIAGKGHEDYQIVGDRRRNFDDRREAALAASGALP